jgi:hypothetical protein
VIVSSGPRPSVTTSLPCGVRLTFDGDPETVDAVRTNRRGL